MIEFVEYKKQKLPLRVSYYALINFKKETGIAFGEQDDLDLDLSLYEPLVFFALESGARAMGEDLKIKRDEIPDLLDECLFEILGLIPKFFPSKEGEEEEAKKNMGLNRSARRKLQKQ